VHLRFGPCVLLLAAFVSAEPQGDGTLRRVLGVATAASVRLDGRLDDAVWRSADSAADFRQRNPMEGAPASERTVVRAARDADALYVAVRAYDSRPGEIRATQLRRDADFASDDYITLIIDSFYDHRTAFVFRTNPNGAMWDSQLNGFESSNQNWNGLWDVAVARDDAGWTAEFRIPFSALRFDAARDAAFGFNVERWIRRTNEQTLWQAWHRTEGPYHLTAEGELRGLGALERPRNVEFRPYALARTVADQRDLDGTRIADGFVGAKTGVDGKIAITPTLTGDVTVNTDFAQVEVDQQVINLTRFPTFFPEKRDFFLEGSGIFDFGSGERAQLFYSRRVGLVGGVPVPILGGARVTGRAGPWTIGLLDARTGGVDAANDAVIRVKRDLLARSTIGAVAVNRSGPGVAGSERAAGVDMQLPLEWNDQNIVPAVWVAGTQAPAVSGTPLAWRASLDYPNDLFDNFISFYRIDANFRPTLGFVRRTGIVETTGHVDYMPRPNVLGIRQLDLPLVPSWDIIADDHASIGDVRRWQTASFIWNLLDADFHSGDALKIGVQRQFDAPPESFEVFNDVDVEAGRYWWTRGVVEFEMSAGRPFSLEAATNFGGFYDGNSTELALAGTWRGGGHVILGADVSRTQATLTNGRFTAVETSARLEYALSTRANLLAFAQFNNEDARADFNVRFHWIPKIGDDVYVVWNSGYSTDPEARYRFPSRNALRYPLNGALVMKVVHRMSP
jgi:hypothetical protein